MHGRDINSPSTLLFTQSSVFNIYLNLKNSSLFGLILKVIARIIGHVE